MVFNLRKALLIPTLGFLACVSSLRAQDAPPAEPPPAPEATPEPTPVPPVQQVRAEMRILEWQLNNTTDFDFAVMFTGAPGDVLSAADLTLPASSPLSSAARVFLTGLDTGSGDFEAVIETLERVGQTKVLSQPSVLMTVGAAGTDPDDKSKPAAYLTKMNSNTRIPFASAKAFGTSIATTTDFRNEGVTLECNAQSIKYDEFVKLQISTNVTDLTGFINVTKDQEGNELRVPVLDERKIVNQILVRDRSVFIAGLLKSTRETERRRGIPWISELPILRSILSNRVKETEVVELVFLVRPEILDPIMASN